MLNRYKCVAAVILFLFGVQIDAQAKENDHASGKPETFLDDARWAIDFSSRGTGNIKNGDTSTQHALGLDFHKVISTHNRDIATIVFQPYWMTLSNVTQPPRFFENGDDSEINWRITNINFTGMSKGGFNIRVGHFEVPFGLEQNLDSNGTLQQFTFRERGIKADWGVSINGVLPSLDYETSLSRGSGNEWENEGDPYLFSGRLGTPSHKNIVWGASYLYGDILTGDNIERRQRIGMDFSLYRYNWQYHTELSLGQNGDDDTTNVWFECVWNNRVENLAIYAQWQYNVKDTPNDNNTTYTYALGSKWTASQKITFSGEWKIINDESSRNLEDQDSFINLQFRIRI